jgi:hypothetical protein
LKRTDTLHFLIHCIVKAIIALVTAGSTFALLWLSLTATTYAHTSIHSGLISSAVTVTVPANIATESLFLTSTLRVSPPAPTTVNGLPLTAFVWIPIEVRENVQRIYAEGQARGNIAGHFSAIGDSSIAGGQFLERFAKGPYKLGKYAYLQSVITAYSSSFTRTSTSVRIGMHSWTALNPNWANKALCKPNEGPVACEIRIQQPSVIFIRLGANDSPASLFEQGMRSIINTTVEHGVVPILITKANSPGAITNANNGVLRRLAEEFKVPLIDFEALSATLPSRGLGQDTVHMTGYGRVDYTLPNAFRSGHGVHNLAALIGLDEVWRTMRAEPR